MKRLRSFVLWAAAFGGASSQASLFEIYTYTTGVDSVATGTSSGMDWDLQASFIYGARTQNDNGWNGFVGPNFSIPLPATDRLHGTGFRFTFAAPIQSALIYVSDDDGNADIVFDFGVTPSLVSGDVTITGTGFGAYRAGGIVRLDGIDSTVLTTARRADGNDFAIVVIPVPEPATLAALALGAGLLMRKIRR